MIRDRRRDRQSAGSPVVSRICVAGISSRPRGTLFAAAPAASRPTGGGDQSSYCSHVLAKRPGLTQPFQAGPDELWKASAWTEVSSDALDRVTQVLGPDGSRISLFHNEANRPSVFAGLPGRTVRVVDAWGRERWALTDALGRLIVEVDPDPDGNGSVFDANAAATFYNRDALDWVVRVGQYPGPQNRMFRYDSLGRLTYQYMPEKGSRLNDAGHYGGIGTLWSDVFTYDERSNITSHTDSRG